MCRNVKPHQACQSTDRFIYFIIIFVLVVKLANAAFSLSPILGVDVFSFSRVSHCFVAQIKKWFGDRSQRDANDLLQREYARIFQHTGQRTAPQRRCVDSTGGFQRSSRVRGVFHSLLHKRKQLFVLHMWDRLLYFWSTWTWDFFALSNKVRHRKACRLASVSLHKPCRPAWNRCRRETVHL